jgi:hypothetical protein
MFVYQCITSLRSVYVVTCLTEQNMDNFKLINITEVIFNKIKLFSFVLVFP